ncbi:MaoC/PaaZ C-terminal domain-containing protein [Stappia sp. MMSF_3263]|uniref:MaoC/PaaZ C-terminal domain-containing protein n=1 Tax=Stappia sp. MMSF_3263 TaxID=3046693 RepID=UPI00273EBF62|nr:MaoC/PaaZ C-terminal domain-containing protein [Stappia sp. MMSF_3263]
MSEAAFPVGHKFADTAPALLDAARVAAYADASGDRNPIHLDEDAARAAGLPGTIVHGMLMMGHFERALRGWLPGTDIRSLQIRFLRPLAVGARMTISGRVAKLLPGEVPEMIVRLTVQDDAGQSVSIGDATVRAGNI